MRHIRKKTELYKSIIEAHEARTAPIVAEENSNESENVGDNEVAVPEITKQE